jgi:hypothetical protein
MARTRKASDDAVRITTAAASRQDDLRMRQRRYLMSMSLRTICFVGAIVAALNEVNWLWPILIAAAIVLPYLAVVMANAAASRQDGFDLRTGDFSTPRLDSGEPHPPKL